MKLIDVERFATRETTRQSVFEYIEIDYNRTRRHGANGCLNPEVLEAKLVALKNVCC